MRFAPCVRALSLVASMLGAATGALAQGPPGGRCDLVFDQTPTTRVTASKIGGTDQYNTFIGGGVNARCEGQDVRLRADSAEAYGQSNIVYLIGAVRYTEPRVRVDANRMTYFRNDERLLMEGNVVAVLPSGTTMRGPQADYYRAVVGVRPRSRLVAPGRPTVTLVERDTVGRSGEPTRIVANLITMDGDSLVYASGSVEITRTDIEARGDSAFMDSGSEFARLMRQPRIVGRQRRPFTLEGGVIDLFSRRRQVQRVLAKASARATSEELRLESDTIDMRMSADSVDNTIERVYAWGRSRARAISPERDMIADSLDVRMPRQRLQLLYAVGKAFAQTVPDTTRIRSTERDWMRGDTIIARFDTTRAAARGAAKATPAAARGVAKATPAAADTATERPRLERLDAVVEAQALYQTPNRQGPSAPPSLCYSRGQHIVLTFAEGVVDRVTIVRGDSSQLADGVCIEPAADSARAAAGRPPAGRPGKPGAPTVPPTTPPASPGTTQQRPVAPPVRRP
jgi:lipopolysaccharide export system protein LptA